MLWDPLAIPGIVHLLLTPALGVFVYFASPGVAQNRWLGLLLVTEGLSTGLVWGVAALFGDDAATVYALYATQYVLWLAQFFTYLLFLGTLDTPVVRFLKARWTKRALGAGIVLSPALWALVRGRVFESDAEGVTLGEGAVLFEYGFLPVLALSLAATFSLLARAPKGTSHRKRAAAYAAAFLVFDASWFVMLLWGGPIYAALSGSPFGPVRFLADTYGPIIGLAFASLLAFGILRAQLFGIELRLKWTISRGTMAAAFLAVFFAVGQVAQNFLSDALGLVVGGVAAGLLLFALRPLQRLADRVADSALPDVSATPAYFAYRKLEVYRAAVESAWEDGALSPQDRTILERLRAKLGVAGGDAAAVEADVAAARAA